MTPRTFKTYIEQAPINNSQLLIATIIVLALVVDGLDLLMLAFISPLMIEEWEVDKASFGVALSAALITMAIGAFVGGWAGDRFGRQRILMISIVSFSSATMLTSMVTDLFWLTNLRLASGLGFGAATPNGLALVTEWLPDRARARVASAVSVASPLGGIIAGSVALLLVPTVGWQGSFVVSGIIALIIGLIVLLAIPESPTFLAANGRSDQAHKMVSRIFGYKDAEMLTFTDQIVGGSQQNSIFSRSNLRFNISLSTAFFCCSFVTFAVSSWITVVLKILGLTFSDAAQGLLWFNVLAVMSAFIMPPLLTWFGSRTTMLFAASMTLILCGFLIGITYTRDSLSYPQLSFFLWTIAGSLGLSQGLFNATFYVVIASGYSTSMRASGSGFALMVNRAGGVLSIFASGVIMTATQDSAAAFALTLGGVIILAMVAVMTIDRHIPKRSKRSTR